MDGLAGISRSLYGQPWSCWSTVKELDSEEETPQSEFNQPAADVMRLPKEDMTLFGFCPEQDDFYIVICELCGLGIKPMGMHHHMNLRHSQGAEVAKVATPTKITAKECDVKPKNKKLVSQTSVVSDYGLGIGPPQKPPPVGASAINRGAEAYNETLKSSANSKTMKLETDKLNKISSGSKYNVLQNSHEGNIINKATGSKLASSKPSRSIKTGHVDVVKPSKTMQKVVPIKAGFRLQLFGSSNDIIFRKHAKSVLHATSELKLRHKKKHRKSRSSKKTSKPRSSKKIIPILPKIPVTLCPYVAPCPSLAPSPYVALTPMKPVKWKHVNPANPHQIKAGHTHLHGSGGTAVSAMQISKPEEPVLQILTIDTTPSNNVLHSELRPPVLACKRITTVRNQTEIRLGSSHMHGNNSLLPAVLPQIYIRLPDITWSSVHPKPLGVCPLLARKVGGLITTDRRLDRLWQSVKSALLGQDIHQSTLLCSASSSQSDVHLNHKSSIKTILASLAENNYARNSISKPPSSTSRQHPHGIKSDKPSLSNVIDASSSLMILSSNNSKSISNSISFVSHSNKAVTVIKHNSPNATTQPYPGIFLQNGRYFLPKHCRTCLKRRKPMPVKNDVAKKRKEKSAEEIVANCRNSHTGTNLPKSVPIRKFPVPTSVPVPIKPRVVHSLSMLPSNGEGLCESPARLSELHQLKNNILAGIQSFKKAARMMVVNHKPSCHKTSCHKTSCHKASCHKASCNKPSYHKASCHKPSCHKPSCRKGHYIP